MSSSPSSPALPPVPDPMPFERLAGLLVELLASRPLERADAAALAGEVLRLRWAARDAPGPAAPPSPPARRPGR
jgi:hypothetical protein